MPGYQTSLQDFGRSSGQGFAPYLDTANDMQSTDSTADCDIFAQKDVALESDSGTQGLGFNGNEHTHIPVNV
jgi:hypothetical protein